MVNRSIADCMQPCQGKNVLIAYNMVIAESGTLAHASWEVSALKASCPALCALPFCA